MSSGTVTWSVDIWEFETDEWWADFYPGGIKCEFEDMKERIG